MPIAEARINTERPTRYLVQFCKHADAMGSRGHRVRMHGPEATTFDHLVIRAEWSDTSGTVSFDPWGQCRLEANEATLFVRVEADDADHLRRIEEILTNDFDRFSRHEMTLVWRPADDEPTIGEPG